MSATPFAGAGAVSAAVARPHSTVLVDFDETLWLRSSTETYLDTLRPRVLAVPLLTALDVLRPWALLPGDRRRFVYRDWLRVLVASVLLPWSLLRWRRIAPGLGRRWQNEELLQALGAARSRPVHVVTFGFRPVVAPLLAGIDAAARLTVVGGLLDGPRLRREGKRVHAERVLGETAVAEAVLVTDSEDDADLLEVCRSPVLTRWPGARYERAFSDAYQPLLYTRKGKRAGQKYLLQHVLLEDVLLLSLAAAWTMERPLLGAVALLLLHLSFWLVYEIGYHENDHLAALRERAPSVPEGAEAYRDRMKPRAAWATALAVGLSGAALLALGNPDALALLDGTEPGAGLVVATGLLWAGYLCAARALYWAYNRFDPRVRGLPYAGLQVARTLGYAVVVTLTLPGALALAAVVVARWVPYAAYRSTGTEWASDRRMLLWSAFVVMLCLGLALDAAAVLVPQTVVIALWLAARAHRPLRQTVRQVLAGNGSGPPAPAGDQRPGELGAEAAAEDRDASVRVR